MAIATGTAILGSALLGGAASMYAGSQASKAQSAAADKANALQMQMFMQQQGNAQPFISGGQGAFNMLMGRMGDLTKPFAPKDLEGTPGYKFALDQTLKAGQNSFAAKGLGSSGASVKGAQDRALGLASTTYQQQLDNYLRQNSQEFNMLMGGSQLGANAAAGQAGVSAQVGQSMGQNLMGVGNANAAAWMSGANALGSGMNNVTNYMAQQDLLKALMNPNKGG